MELALALAIAYLAFAPDGKTLRATRGVAGMGGAAVRGGRAHYRAERAKSAAARKKKHDKRQKEWRESGWLGQLAVAAENAAAKAGHGMASTVRAAAVGAKTAPTGYAPAAERAAKKRAETLAKVRARTTARKARREERFRMADQTPEPTEPTPPTTQKETPMSDAPSIPTTDLENLDEMAAETTTAQHRNSEIAELETIYSKWRDSLGERYDPNKFGTTALTQAVVALIESDQRILAAIEDRDEKLIAVQNAIRAARDLGDQLADAGATGKAEAFQAA